MTTTEAQPQVLSTPDADLDLLSTKFARPRVPPAYVPRSRVDGLLEAGTAGPLTVVSAGPGWGKTLAAAHWAAAGPAVERVAWVSLDRGDNDPQRFWSYFVAALRAAGGVPSDNPLAHLAPGHGTEDEYLRRLLTGLAALPGDVAVLLDDFQLIDTPAVLAQVAELLRHRLDRLHLVLLTRSDPTLPLHRLRISEELTEVRQRDLAFNAAEASALLEAHGVSVSAHDAQLLVDRTEGWPTGLRLASLFLERDEPDREVADFAGNDQAVTSYLAEEVLDAQPPDVRRFLLHSSVVERVCSGLAEVLTGQPHAQQHLEALERSNAFVVGLGAGREWFRYHALLREMLQHRLEVEEPELVPDLHRRAARWYAEQGHPIEALNHAADAEDWTLVSELYVTQALPLLVSMERTALDEVLARIPSHHLADSAEMALCAASRVFYAGRFNEMQSHLDVAAALLDDTSSESGSAARVALLFLRLAVARANGDIAGVIDGATESLEIVASLGSTLPVAEAYRGVALGNLGTGLLWSGRIGAAEVALEEALRVGETTRIEVAHVNVLAHLALLCVTSGRLRAGYRYATRAVELVESRGWTPLPQVATAYLALATAEVLRNNVDRAQALLATGRGAAAAERSPRLAMELAHIRLEASLGRTSLARDHLASLRTDLAGWTPPTLLARWLAITEAEVDLASGDPTSAVERIAPPLDHGPPFAHELATLARAQLEHGDARAALATLAPLREEGSEESALVDAWLLTALAADSLREDNRATEALGRALVLAGREQIRRPFVVVDRERLHRLLARLQEVAPELAGAAADLATYLHEGVADPQPSAALPEPLTDRELMVLRYLPLMLTNVEIASELYVSVNTVKAHLKRIFRKLEVETRRQAVHRARELGLLDA